jgi:hypothetical protein
MPDQSPIWNMISSILAIREQNLRESQFQESTNESNQRMGLQARGLDLEQQMQGINRAQEQSTELNNTINAIRSGADPKEYLANVSELSKRTGMSSDFLTNVLPSIVPSLEAQTSRMAKQGSENLSPYQKVTGAMRSLFGMTPYQMSQDQFMNDLLTGTGNQSEDPGFQKLHKFFRDKLATGMTPGEAALDAATAGLGESELTQGAGVRIGTRMGATADDQSRLGWASLRSDYKKWVSAQATSELETRLRMAATSGQHKDQSIAEAQDAVKNMSHFQDMLNTKGSTLDSNTRTLIAKLYDSELARAANALPGYYEDVPFMTYRNPSNGKLMTPGYLRQAPGTHGQVPDTTKILQVTPDAGRPSTFDELMQNMYKRGGTTELGFGTYNSFDAIKNYITQPPPK